MAAIAEAHLSQKAKAGIRDLIADRSIADTRLANWADLIKFSSAFRQKYKNNNLYHFVDIPYEAEGYDKARDGHGGANVIEAVQRFSNVLKNRDDNPTDRKESLLFVVHLMGDMHQPLHCAMRNDDHGGNLLRVRFLEEDDHALNLHKVWDTNLVEQCLRGNNGETEGLLPLDYARRLDAMITSKQKSDWQQGTFEAWVNQTHQIAIDCAYNKKGSSGSLPKTGVVQLDQEYVESNTKVVQQQLQKAGIRLAAVLNSSFE